MKKKEAKAACTAVLPVSQPAGDKEEPQTGSPGLQQHPRDLVTWLRLLLSHPLFLGHELQHLEPGHTQLVRQDTKKLHEEGQASPDSPSHRGPVCPFAAGVTLGLSEGTAGAGCNRCPLPTHPSRDSSRGPGAGTWCECQAPALSSV